MKKNYVQTIARMAILLLVGVASCNKSTSMAESFSYSKFGIASVKIGTDYTEIPYACSDLYSHIEYNVCCGGEDGEGVELLYYNDTPSDFVICAVLNVDQEALNTIYDNGLDCNTYPITDPQIKNVLQQTGSTRIGSVYVAPSAHITVNIDGHDIATNEPIIKFMEIPGAVTTVSLGEGLFLTCTIGGLTMSLMNAYEALSPETYELISEKIAAGFETGIFEPVPISSAEVNPSAQFDYFSY